MKQIIESLRKLSFWLIDWLRGKPVSTHYKQINEHFNLPLYVDQSKLINNLLFHAVDSTGFYQNLAKDTPLNGFPIINKTIIRGSFHDFLSYKFNVKDLLTIVTSGSTGTPFKIYQDKNKKNRNYADTIYFARLSGYEVGQKLLYFKIWAKQKMRNPLIYWLQNVKPIDVIKLDDSQIAELINEIESSNSTFGILGYSSALELVSKYLKKNHTIKVDAKVTSIIAMSESVSSFTKESLKQYFSTEVISRYSNLENGIIAQQEVGSDLYLINTASYYLEILHPKVDEILPDGNFGRIVITDLFNYAMPMIRYDTGDFGIRIKKEGKYYLSVVEGRKLDLIYDTNGNIVSSYIMYKNMWQYTEILQYQLIQIHIKSYEFMINCPKGFNREEQLVMEFKTYLGSDADFRVIYVDEIPLLDSGKRRKTVNLYYK